ncbi:MAG: hypothetical protein IIB19_06930 [Chloroflexi bacterium]|nr:hypothetical protein [Chloroflexota bacterium]
MNDEQSGPPPATEPVEERPGAVISARSALRLVIGLLAMWTLLSGLTLTFFQDASAATIGGGLEGGEGEAAQRLLGVHLLVLAPIYVLLAWDPRRFRLLLWVPYAAQGGVVAATVFDLLTTSRDLRDGALPLIIATIFLVLLVYVWRAGKLPDEEEEEAE